MVRNPASPQAKAGTATRRTYQRSAHKPFAAVEGLSDPRRSASPASVRPPGHLRSQRLASPDHVGTRQRVNGRAHVSASLGGVARGSRRARRVEMNMSRCRPTALPDENRHGSVHVRAAECEGLCGRSQAQHRSSPGDTTAKRLQHDEITLLQPPGTQTMVQRSEEHTSELQSLMRISYAVFCLKKKTTTDRKHTQNKQKK